MSRILSVLSGKPGTILPHSVALGLAQSQNAALFYCPECLVRADPISMQIYLNSRPNASVFMWHVYCTSILDKIICGYIVNGALDNELSLTKHVWR